MSNNSKSEVRRCDCCGEVIKESYTYDVWVFESRFDSNGECSKTGESVENEVFGGMDYLVFGECCKARLADAWNAFIQVMQE